MQKRNGFKKEKLLFFLSHCIQNLKKQNFRAKFEKRVVFL